ncbi:energy transducer TonB [Gracilimonas sp.]
MTKQHIGILALLVIILPSCSYFDFSPDLRFCDDFYVVVEEMPVLIGGMAELQQKVVYPELARERGIEGRVTVQFIVNKLGDPTEVQMVRGIGGGADQEAVRVVKQAKFEPGKQNGKPVCVQYQLSINFRLEN